MRELDNLAAQAAVDDEKMGFFIEQNQSFILNCASRATSHHVTKNDDEWSLALIAFMEATKKYDLSKGSFIHFAELVIKHRLTDHHRRQSKYSAEITVDSKVFDADLEEQVAHLHDPSIKDEIEAADQIFSHYGFSFFELAKCSPKSGKTKAACAKAAAYLLQNPLLVHELHSTKLLPLKLIEINTKVPRKILERHRKYIIAAVEILSGEYPCLAEYMQYIRKELGK